MTRNFTIGMLQLVHSSVAMQSRTSALLRYRRLVIILGIAVDSQKMHYTFTRPNGRLDRAVRNARDYVNISGDLVN